MVRFWNDPKDIKLSILETMADFANRPDLIGWIPGSESVNTGAVAEEIARLTKENSELRERISKESTESTKYNGLTYDEMYALLSKKDLLSFLHGLKGELANGITYKFGMSHADQYKVVQLAEIGLVNITRNQIGNELAQLSEVGKQFIASGYLRLDKIT